MRFTLDKLTIKRLQQLGGAWNTVNRGGGLYAYTGVFPNALVYVDPKASLSPKYDGDDGTYGTLYNVYIYKTPTTSRGLAQTAIGAYELIKELVLPEASGPYTYYCFEHRDHVVLGPNPGGVCNPRPICPKCFLGLYYVPNGGTEVPPAKRPVPRGPNKSRSRMAQLGSHYR